MFSRSKAASWRSGASTWPRRRSSRSGPTASARGGAHPGVLDDRRQVDVADVVVPVDHPGVEAERGPGPRGSARPTAPAAGRRRRWPRTRRRRRRARRSRGPARPPRGAPRAWRPNSACLPRSGRAGSTFSARSSVVLARCSWRLHPAPARERPVGHHDGLALVVVERVLEEPGADQVDQAAVAQRVLRARRHLHDLGHGWPGVALGALGRHGDDGADHEVDGDDVDDALGHAGELLEQAAGVGDDHRLGHAEAADPAGAGLGQRRLDDRRPHDADRHVALGLDQRPLAERLGVGVGVGPAERGGAGPAGLDQSVARPSALAELLGLGGQRRRAGRAELGCGPPCGTRRASRGCGSRPRRRCGPGGRRRPRRASRRPTKNGLSSTSCSRAAPRRLPAT